MLELMNVTSELEVRVYQTMLATGLLACFLVSSCGSRTSPAPGALLLTGAGVPRTSFLRAADAPVCAEPNLVIATHGWYESEPWPGDLATALARQTSAEQWRCGWYDWREKARCLPWEAARLGRDVAGPQLGREIVTLSRGWRHIHLIGHSAGCWLVNAAAQVIAAETDADIHLTFLDAYIPAGWDERELGQLPPRPHGRCWVEQYFTRDMVVHVHDTPLTNACNVDITALSPWFDSHCFPIWWYRATVAGRYNPSGPYAGKTLSCQADGVEYGFARSRESGSSHWFESLALPPGKKTVRISPGAPAQ